MRDKILVSFFVFLFFIPKSLLAIEPTNTTDTNILLQYLMGSTSASNPTVGGHSEAIGIYKNDSHLWGLEPGIILSSGKVSDYGDGPNTSNSFSTAFGSSGYTDLTNLSGHQTYDAARFRFDFTATSNQISFDFVFGSDEYPEYVGSVFNDAFGVYLTDSSGSKTQIAYDNSGDRITINTAWMNTSHGTELDGDTGKLTTTANVLPGKDYRLEFAIADTSDAIYDSTAHISNFEGAREAISENAYGVFIGVNDSNGVSGDLDATDFRNQLVAASILDLENTVLLTGASIPKSEVEDAINGLIPSLEPNDTFFFFFSGHGGSFLNNDETTTTTPDEHMFLGGSDRMTDDEITELLDNIDQVEKWIFLDSCHSGGFWGNNNTGDNGDLETLSNLALFAAAQEDTNSFAGVDGRGLYSNALIDAFSYDGDFLDSDGDHDGFVVFDELDSYLSGWAWTNGLDGTDVIIKDENSDDNEISKFYLSDWVPLSIHDDDFDGSINFYAYLDPNAETNSAPIPEPSTILLLGSGFVGLAGFRRKYKK
ncbi:PEP-CTERM sorting domain-containing protein [Patescibacteria group bacterium]|nr:PEP-CTERM sorting domain-containing protein [Patescibacteria group bacterium]